MSKVLPSSDYDLSSENICPRYKNWLRRITHIESPSGKKNKDKSTSSHSRYKHLYRSLKRKRGKSNMCGEPLVTKKSHTTTNSSKAKGKPVRSKSFFSRIRQKGRNFGIRCKTSVELWRKWIHRGIHWDKTPTTKEVDIDIIKKPENQLKDFTKKSIINEVIPEEDEEYEEDAHHAKSKTMASNGVRNKHNVPQIVTDDKPVDKNFLVDMSYIHRASNLFRHSRGKEDSRENGDISEGKQTNGVAKYPMQDLASMDIGHIEKIEQPTEEKSETTQNRPRVSRHHGAVHRAFNKLKILF